MKFIVFILIIAGGVWCYLNVDFNQVKQQTIQGVKKEKTIFGVNNTREQQRQQTQEVLDNSF